jgi:DNA-binding SARP family transcriptional activator/ABC-type phosphate/phosphonate transport system substrate-binding protein/membrane-associated phospholipid phosphatase
VRTLHLQLLGGFRALLDDEETPALAKQPRRAALLAYLALERDVPRERVMALLWPEADNERGRHSLNQAIYFLRRIISADWVELRGDRLIVAPWVTTDAQQFEHAVSTGDHADALQLYHGSLLGGASLAATAEFDMWADARRAAIDRLHRRARRQHIAALVQENRSQEALQSAEEWARLDPLEDEAHHRYIELLAAAGQRGAALRQFDLYRRLLAEQDLKPLDDTVALVEQLQHGERAAIVPPEPEHTRVETVPRAQTQPHRQTQPHTYTQAPVRAPRVKDRIYDLLKTRRGLRMLLIGVFITNLIESSTENWLAPKIGWVHALRTQLAGAAHWLEGGFRFTQHELANDFAVIGYSIAYYIALPVLLALVGYALAQRASIRPFRVFALAVAIDYLISLPFFLLFPVPERWWHAPSDAIVLSDRWTPLLIELYRPISALDNSFPSFHVSLSVVIVSLSIIYRLRFRWSVLFIGLTVALATIALGIHWITDAIAGIAAGALAVALALRVDRGFARTPHAVAAPPVIRTPVAATAALLALCACALPRDAHAQSTITYLEVSLDDETRRADEKLRRYLGARTGSAFVPERPLEYDAVIDRLAGWRPEKGDFLARTTPYAFVAAEMLGAQLDPVATYVSTATDGTTYHSYFVVNRARFPYRPDLASLVDYLQERATPATFVYHSKFSTSSYFVPALFFRSHGIYHMANATQYHTAIHSQQFGTSATDLVRAVADGTYDLAAVWDGTKRRFENVDSLRERYGSRVHFIQLPTPLPNDLLVISASTDSVTRARLEDAIRGMGASEIGEGDFRTWQHIDAAPAAREALANLRWLARERAPAVTVDVLRSDRGEQVTDAVLDAARQAVRLASAEFVNYDGDFHAHRDYVWTIEHVRDGTIALTSRIAGSDVDDQRFQLSYRDEEELTRRIGDLVHSRLHRIRYIWAYRPERPTIIRDIDFELPAGTEVRVRRIHWLDAQRNHFQEDAEFVAHVEHSDFFKFELQQSPGFNADSDDAFGFDPMSNISYRVVLVRNTAEPGFFRVLTVILVLLLAGAAVSAMVAWRRTAAGAELTGR